MLLKDIVIVYLDYITCFSWTINLLLPILLTYYPSCLLITHLAYLLPMPLGTEKRYRLITTIIVLFIPLSPGTCDG